MSKQQKTALNMAKFI
ncbi:TPA: Rop family plasmid primer RNA-binding protein [Klebsiella pneumoniae]|nr:Rop family plasmid primer RNA-binding protein [Klebsiella pneumoniae]HEF8944038.1 Rop family plasmid primer RNA-binding protein [Klebsiella pneumoniae]